MSDELDFGFESETTGTPITPEVMPPETTAPAGPPPEEFAAMQKRLENAERWQQDLQRFVSGQQPQQQQPDPIQRLVQDPDGFYQDLSTRAINAARAEMQEEAAINKVRSEFPELAPFEQVIDWGALMKITAKPFFEKHGRKPSLEEALRESATYFKSNLQGSGNAQQQAQRDVLRLNAGGSPPPNAAGALPDPNTLSREAFYAKQAELQKQYYQ